MSRNTHGAGRWLNWRIRATALLIGLSFLLLDAAAPGNGIAATSSSAQELDLREANVTAVTYEKIAEGGYRFEVTLYHDDDGEAPKYANWWQVETVEGEVLGKRELLHSHSTAPFTRSATISVPDSVTTVVVRGHDMIHGFGGQAARVNVKTAEVEFFFSDID
jgi:hypothetical protein